MLRKWEGKFWGTTYVIYLLSSKLLLRYRTKLCSNRIDKIVPRWMFHVGQKLILDSNLYLLHVEEKKIMDVGKANWHKACFVPTKADALIGFRKWLKKYAGGEVDWREKYTCALPPTPPREELMDRYWSHVVNCKSCNLAYKSLNVMEVMLQIISVASIEIVATMKQGVLSAVTRNSMIMLAVLSFALSRLLAHFIYKNFVIMTTTMPFAEMSFLSYCCPTTLLRVYIYSEVLQKQSQYYRYLREALYMYVIHIKFITCTSMDIAQLRQRYDRSESWGMLVCLVVEDVASSTPSQEYRVG